MSNGVATMAWQGAHCPRKKNLIQKAWSWICTFNIKYNSLSVIMGFWFKYIRQWVLWITFNLWKKKYELTWRLWGTDGAGRENLPRATTAWNIQTGKNTVLHGRVQTCRNQNYRKTNYNTQQWQQLKVKIIILIFLKCIEIRNGSTVIACGTCEAFSCRNTIDWNFSELKVRPQ